MKKALLLIVLCVASTSCMPYLDGYKYVRIMPHEALTVKEFGYPDDIPEHSKYFFDEEKVPIEYVLTRGNYKIYIKTPLGVEYIDFKVISNKDNVQYVLQSENPKFYSHKDGSSTLMLIGRSGGQIAINVVDLNNQKKIEEVINYKIKNLGYIYGIDAI